MRKERGEDKGMTKRRDSLTNKGGEGGQNVKEGQKKTGKRRAEAKEGEKKGGKEAGKGMGRSGVKDK